MKSRAQLRRRARGAVLLVLAAGIALAFGFSSGSATLTDPCSSPGWNVVTCENSKLGTPPSSWNVGGAGDATLQGFATSISVNHGQTVSFKITDTNGGTGVGGAYHIDIYRVGYYQGNGARLQVTIPSASSQRTAQPSCLTEAATGLIDCGNWTVSASWAVPATAVSGLYFANLVRDTTGANSHVYFVVRDDERHAPVLFQTSDETWQAYNSYGGNSLYIGTAPTSNGRAYKVSYNRPLSTGNNSPRNEPMYAEYPMIRFLERNGYDVSYFSDVDSARSGAEILNHQAFLSVGHDEYWSAEQRSNVTAARDAGVNLAFFSGNEIFWKTRFAAAISSDATAMRTVVCYKESKESSVPIDPADPPVSTGAWRDPRFGSPADGARPENALSGQIYAVDAIRDDAIAVPYAYSKLRFWSNTSIAALSPGQTATLPTGTLGYEWDEDRDNGSRPRGVIQMSSTTVPVTTLVTDSTGQIEGSGNATHHLTLYRAPSGSLVFGAGTVQWSFGLDDQHTQAQDSSNPLQNADMQQATVNLLADMNAQPATLQSGVVQAAKSADTTPPTSSITSPAPGAMLSPTQSATVTGTASDAGGVVGGVEVSVDGGTTWHPATGTASWSYTFIPSFGSRTIMSRATDDSANVQTTPASVTVQVGSCPCTIFAQTVTPQNAPAADPNPYELGVKFRSDTAGYVNGIRFYKTSGNTGTHVGHLWTATGALLATATFSGETATGWQQVNFSAPVAINANSTYVASYFTPTGNYAADRPYFATSGVDAPPLHALADGVDGPNGVYAAGGGFPASTFQATNYYADVVFTTANPPAVTAVTPASGSTGAATSTPVTATFTQALNAATVTTSTVMLRDPSSALIPATVAYDAATQTATLTPTQPLSLSTTYTATVKGGPSGVANPNGDALSADYTWSFTTATPAACPCTIFPASATPTTASSFDTTANELGVKFRSDESGYIRGIRFYKGPGNTGTHLGHLWSSSGAMLAEISFANETAGGWQQVNFARPVAITANTTYIASYYAPNGGYALDRPYFSTSVDHSPLHALADGVSGPNGVFAAGGGFPAQGSSMSNYWVDAVFDTNGNDLTPPVVTSVSPTTGATGIATSRTVAVAFDEPIDPLSVTTTNLVLRNASNVAVPLTVSYDSAKQSVTLAPSSPLALSTTYTVVVKGGTGGVRDSSGNVLGADYTSAFTTGTPTTCPCNLLASAAPSLASTTDTAPTELGVKFRSDVDGYVTGLRFYKGAQNTGTHVGHLWSSSGTLMGSATFASETSTGWQQVSFSPAIAVTANTTYVASYFAPNGGYALDRPYFASWLDRSPLHALAEGVEGSNGVYAAGQGFPNQAFDSSASNYWVDPVFDTVANRAAVTVSSTTPASNATGVSRNTSVTAVFSAPLDPTTVNSSTMALLDASNAAVPATVVYSAAASTATLTPTAPLTAGAVYSARITSGSNGVKDTGGASLAADYTWSFTISTDATPPATTIACNTGGCANWFGTSPVTVALSASDNVGGSGLNATKYTLDGSDPTTSASAAVYTSPFTVATTTTVRYFSTDQAGNVEAPGSTQVRIDTTPPTAPSLSFGAFSNASGSGSTVYFNPAAAGGFTLTASATDAESGVSSVNYPSLGSGWTRAAGAYTFVAGAVDPLEPNNVTAVNNAGLTSGATSFSVTADGTAPATSASCNGVVCPVWSTSSPVSVALNATDTGSGVAATYYTTDGSDPSVVHGTLYLGAFPVAVTTTVKFRSYDNVGNAGTIGSQLVQIDTTAPSAPALALTEASPFEYSSGSTLYYSPSGANSGGFTVGATTADAESGVSKVTFPAVTGMTGGGDVLSGPYQTTYSWSAPTATSGSQNVSARNTAGLTASSGFTLTPDTTAPSGGSIVYTDGYTAAGTISITTTNGSDAGAGLDTTSGVLQRDAAALTNGACAAFPGTWTTAVSPDTTLVSATCYRYRYLVSDNVGNTAVYTSASVVKADSTAPSTPVLTLSSASATQFIVGTTIYYGTSSSGSFTVAATSADGESGIKQVNFPTLTGMTGGGADTSSPYQGVYNWTTSSTTTGVQNVTATNNANLASGNASFTVTLDASVPTLSIASPATGAKLRNGAVLTPSVSDAGSGMKQVEFRYCLGTGNCNFNSGTAIGTATSAPFTVTWNSQPADGSYTIVARATDNVGNTTTTAPAAGTQVILDNTVPLTALSLVSATASYLNNAGTLYFANTAGSFTIHVDVLDPQPASGVKNIIFPAIATTGWTGASSVDTTVPYENPYSFPASAGTPTAKTIATSDNAGNLQNDTITFVKDQTAPSVSLTAPATGVKLKNGATISATASDAGAGIRQVEFRYCPGTTCAFASGTTLGTATSAPYTVAWNGQPADGTYTIAVQATDNVGNTATDGTATVTLDNTPPATTLTVASGTRPDLQYFAAGTLYYNPAATGDFTVSETATDLSGVASVAFPAVAQTGFNGTAKTSTVTPYVSNTYTFGATNVAAPSPATVVATDTVGNNRSDSLLFVLDNTAPAGGSITYPDGYAGGGTVAITTNSGADPGAGIAPATAVIERQVATLAGDTCATFGAWTPVTSPDTLATGTCARYRFRVSDRVGNQALYTSTNTAKSDTSAAAAPTLAVGSFTGANATGSTVYYNPVSTGGFTVTGSSTDPESGVASYSYPSLGSGWSNTGGSYTFAAGATDPVEPNNVTATNGAGLISAPASFTVSADANAPATTASCNGTACGGWFTSSPVSVTLNATDGGSGVDRLLYSTDGSAPSTVYNGPITVSGTTTVKYAAVDKVGNTEATHAQPVQVDTSAPVAPALALGGSSGGAALNGSTLYFNPASAGGFTVTPSSTDPESGIDHYTYPALGSGWSATGGAYTFAAGATDPVEPNNVTAINGAGLASSATSFTVSADTTAPTTSASCAGGCSGWHSSAPAVTLSAIDGGSGVDRVLYSTDGSTPSTVYSGPFTVGSTTTVKYAAVDRVGNTETAKSQLVQVDTTAPTAPALTLSAVTGTAVTGATVFYNPAATGSFTVAASSTDAESGVASYAYPSLGLGWSNTGGSYTFAAGAFQPGPANVTATNNAGLTSPPTSFTATADTTAPTTSATCNGGPCAGWQTSGSVSVALSATDGGSGLDRVLYSTDGSTPATLYTAPFTLAATTTVKYAAYDRVGNLEATKTQLVQIDTTAPSAPSLAFGGFSNAALTGGAVYYNANAAGGFTVTGSSSDPESGVATYGYPALGTGWSGTGGVYSFGAGATAPSTPSVTATNNAGLISTATPFTVTADGSAPATTITCNGGSCFNGWYGSGVSVTLTASDGGSGVNRILYSTDGTAPSTLYSGPFTVNSAATVKYAATDKVGNAEVVKSQLVQIDTTAPSAPALSFGGFSSAVASGSTVYYNANTAGGFTVTGTSTDAESGVATYGYPTLGTGWTGNGTYTFAAGATQPTAPSVTATNNAGLTSTATPFTVTADGTAPTTSVACSSGCNGWHTASPVTITLSATDGGSGVNRILYSTDGAAPSTLYTTPFTVNSTTTVKYAAVDKVGNSETTKSQLVQIDTTAPTPPSLAFSGFSNAVASGSTVYYNANAAGGFTVTGSSSDAESGVATYGYPGLGTGWSGTGGVYTFAAGATQPTAPSVTATNNAGLTSTATPFTVTADGSAPATTITCNGGTCSSGWYGAGVSVTLTAADTGSGVNRLLYSTDGTAPSTVYSSPFTVTATTTIKYAAADKVGNTETTKSQLVQIDQTLPSSPALTLSDASPYEFVSGTTLYYNPSGANSGSFTVAATSSSPSGIQKITFPSIAGLTGGGDSLTSPYTSVYSWTAGATAAGDQTVTAMSNSGATSSSVFTLAVDKAAPTGQTIALAGGPRFTTASIPFATGDGVDGAAGLDLTSRLVERSSAALANGTCGTFGAYGGAYTSPDTTVASGQCYRYRYSIADRVGNRSATVESAVAQVDLTPPTAPTISFSSLSNASATGSTLFYNANASGGFTVGATSVDAESGIASYGFSSLGSGWSNTGGAYSFIAGAGQPGQPGAVTATNAFGVSSSSTNFTATADGAPPSTAVSCNGAACSSGWYSAAVSVALAAGDAGSGVNRVLYSTDGSTPSTAYTGPFTVSSTTTVKYAAIDNVGNAEAPKTQLIQVDLTAPTAPSLAFGGFTNASASGGVVFYNSNTSGGFTVTPSSTDAESGIDHYNYPSFAVGWSRSAGAYSFGAGAAQPSGPNSVSATNGAGLTSSATGFAVTADGTAPTTSLQCNGGSCGTGAASTSVAMTLTATDGVGSGVTTTIYTLDGSDPSPIHGTVYLSGFTVTATTTVKYRSYDAVGNAEAIRSQLVKVDTTAPTAPVLSLTAPSASEYATGTTLYYNPSGTNSGSFTVSASASDPESGISKVNFPAIGGLSGGGDTTSTFSSTYAWSAATTAAGNQTVTAYNGAGLTSTAAFQLAPDTSPPSGGSVSYPNGVQSTGSVTISTVDGTDTGAGIDPSSRTLERQTAALAAGACQSFGSWSAVTSPDTVPDATCVRYRYRVADRVGNQQIYTSTNVVQVDSGVPTGPTLSLSAASPFEFLTGTTLYYNPSGTNSGSFTVTATTSAASGIAKVTFPSLAGMSGGGDVTTTPYAATYNWTASATATGGQTVAAKSNAGGSSTSSFTVTPDTTAPSGQTAAIVGGPWFTSPSVAITTTSGSDAGSGLATATALLERASAPLTNGTCGSFVAYGGSYTSPDTSVVSGRCYRYRYSIADKVGNRSTPVETAIATVDTTAPTAPALTFSGLTHASVAGSTLYYNTNTAGGFTVGATSTDAESGVASYAFPNLGTGWTGTSGVYSFTSSATAPAGPSTVTATNAAGLASNATSFSVLADGNAPSGGSLNYADGYATTASVTISLANGSDLLSGIDGASTQLQRASATMTDGSCATFSAYTTIATAPTLSYTDTTVTSGNCYRYRYLVDDKVGNEATYASPAIVKLDTNAPTATLGDPGANLRGTVNLTSATADTGGSGVGSVTYQRSDPSGWVTIPQAWDTTTATDGLYDLRVVVIDRAGNSTTSAVVTGRRVDNTPPSAALADPGAYLRGTVTLSATTSDAGSGVASVTYQRSDATAGWVTIPATWDTTAAPDGSYDVRVVVLDVAGNQTVSTVTGRIVDNAPPTATMGTLGTPIRGTITLTSTTGDAGSGVASVTYERQTVGQTNWVATPSSFDTTTVSDGDYDIHVLAVDKAGNSTASTPVRTHVDNTSPRPTAVSPAAGASSVASSTAITATFPRAMSAATISTATFTVNGGGSSVAATVVYNPVTLKATLTPTAALADNTTYTATLTRAVTAQDGASLYEPYTWTFSTGLTPPPPTPPTVTAKTPTDGTTGVAVTAVATATFSKAMDATTINATTATISATSGAVASTVTYDAGTRTVTIAPTAPLTGGVTYTVRLSGLAAQDGTALAPVSWSFTTAGAPVPPTIVSRTPAPGATGVATATSVVIGFSRGMASSTLTTSTVTLTGPSGRVGATVAYDGSSKAATLSPSSPLASNTTYTASVDSSVQAADGTPLGTTSTWSFTTTNAPEVRSTTPADGATSVSMTMTPTIQMSTALDAATVTTTNVKLVRPDASLVPITVTYSSSTFKITLTPSAPLDYSGKFTIRLETGITAGGVPLAAPFTSTFTTTGAATPTRIDAGSTTGYTASSGNVFSADSGFLGGTARAVTNTVSGADPALYKTERYGTWQYSIPVPNGNYDVKLHFVELTYTACSKRIFSVDILNTATVNDVSNLDVFCEVGANAPDIKTISGVTVTARSLRLKAVVGTDSPEIAAIEILPHPPTAALPPSVAAATTGVAVTTTPSAVFSQAMDASSLTPSTVTLAGPGGALVPAAVSYDSASKTVTLTPTAPLAHSTTYTARLDGSIRDSYGMIMGSPYSWTIATG